jgi:rep protein
MKLSKEEQEYILKNRENQNIYRKAEKKFLMLPALLIYGELYRGLDSGAKIAWTILNDRANLSKKNGWYDEEGNVYFVYTNQELMNLVNVSEPTIVKIKKELISYGLLEQKRMGRGKANLLYIYEPVASKSDAQNLIEIEDVGNALEFQNLKNLSSRTENNLVQELKKIKHNNNKNNNINFNNIESVNESERAISNRLKKEELLTDYSQMGISSIVTDALFRAIRDVNQISYILGVLFKAKKEVYNFTGRLILLEELTEEENITLAKTLLRVLKKQYTDKTIKNFDRYLFVSLREYFEEYINHNGLVI